ncbi:PTS sugar transporter subunit IIA [Enterococcus lemanii]|uniref:PTS sugar transporter subunit IIA n=1 Tax=Enterococcus lemanii TaxID=1159752 RepID=A0ABV9MUY5_9ENTE|nr:PTS N-acetylglucosamine transporter subunit IIBC [Enterococcus lemanii]MBM7708436.1 mannose/fructose-specific phosphotransferase system component IIA [Enterococcus lemanii]NLM65868.1 PTS N-acetylglucosamine transporter subunit IIBC [Enterococcus sp.]
MRKIIFASHHHLASGLKETIEYIVPNGEKITAISAYTTNTPVEAEINDALKDLQPEDEALVFTDLLGGSVNQAFTKYLNQGNVHVIAGMNVPVVLTVLLGLTKEKTTSQQIQQAILEGQQQLVYVNDYFKQQELDEDDE